MNWSLVRLLTYVAMMGASLLAFAGLADFDASTGMLEIHPFNLYAATAAVAGFVSSTLAAIALVRGWGGR